MLSAYFDTSGNKRSPVMTMAGFVSRVDKWDHFQREWSDRNLKKIRLVVRSEA
jgi:hypothetical protein